MVYSRDEFNQYINQELISQEGSGWDSRIKNYIPLGLGVASIGFDRFHKFLQHAEGAAPMGILSTFRLSEFTSPLVAPESFVLSATQHRELFSSKSFQSYLSRITDTRVTELSRLGAFSKGIEFQRTGSFGTGTLRIAGGGPTISSNAAAMFTGPRRTGTVLEWFDRVSGGKNSGFFRAIEETDDYLRPSWMPIGSKGGKAKLAGKSAYGAFSWGIERLNKLLQSPFDLEIFSDIAHKLPVLKRVNLGVKPGTGLQMLSRYTAKAGVAVAGWHGVKYLDYASREWDPIGRTAAYTTAGAAVELGIGLKRGSFRRTGLIGAAVGAALSVFSPFRNGPIAGSAEIYSKLRIGQASFAKTSGLQGGAERAEEMFPGINKPTTLVGMAGVGLLLGGTYEWGKKLSAARAVSASKGHVVSGKIARDVYEAAEADITSQRKMLHEAYSKSAEEATGALKLLRQAKARFLGGATKGGQFNAAGAGRFALLGGLAYSGLNTLGSLISGDILGGLVQGAATVGSVAAYAKKGGAGAAIALALPFLFREKEDPEKLRKIYSGEEYVPIKSGRWWEAGRSPYEGKRPYFRPHRVAMMKEGGLREKALYGSEKAYWGSDPVLSPLSFLWNPYEREELMWEQGYKFPVSKTPFEDFPILGPILASTVGQILKPAAFMGKDQWRVNKSANMGPFSETSPEDPVLRTGLQGTIGEQLYRTTELVGLPGFALSAIKQAVTGEESFFPSDQWATPSLVSGMEPSWWSLNLGGGLLLSEGIRRYIPHKRNEIEYKNPLPSDLPSWLPGEDSGYFLDFSKSDIYHKIQEPWARLPGAGYAALNPEVRGVDPEQYPAFHRFKVLCLSPDTEIFTVDGTRRIEDIRESDLIYGKDGELCRVLEIAEKIDARPGISIKTYYNSEISLVSSEEHRILAADSNGNIIELPASNLTEDYYLLFPLNLIELLGPIASDIKSSTDFCFITPKFIAFRIKEILKVDNPGKWIDIYVESRDGNGYFTTTSGIVHNSDLAPWSYEYGKYSKIVSNLAAKGRLTPEQMLEFQRVKKQVKETKRPENHNQYRYSSESVERKTVRITDVVGPGEYKTDTFGSASIKLAGVDSSSLAIATELQNRDASLSSYDALKGANRKRAQMSDFLRDYIYPGAEVDVFIHKDPSSMIERGETGRPQIQAIVESSGRNINQALVEEGLALPDKTDVVLDAGAGVGKVQRTFGAFWERLMHNAETPLESFVPFAPAAKFMHQRTALEEYQRSEVYARDIAMWNKPVSHFIAPGLSTTMWWMGWRGLPNQVKQRYMIEEYFDRLEYMKARRIESTELARGAGESAAASAARGDQYRTKTGANKFTRWGPKLALSSKERAYFEEFVKSPNETERSEIRRIVSPQMRSLLEAQWSMNQAEAALLRREAGISRDDDRQRIAAMYMRQASEEQGHLANMEREAMETMPVPKPSWIGWSNNVDLEDVKVKTVLQTSHDYHDFGIWRSDIRRVNRRPYVQALQHSFESDYGTPAYSEPELLQLFGAMTGNMGSPYPSYLQTSSGEQVMNASSPGYDRLGRYLRDPTIMQF